MSCRRSVDKENNDPSGEGVPMNKAQVYIAETMKSGTFFWCVSMRIEMNLQQ